MTIKNYYKIKKIKTIIDTFKINNRSKLPPKPPKTIPDARLLRVGAPRSLHIFIYLASHEE